LSVKTGRGNKNKFNDSSFEQSQFYLYPGHNVRASSTAGGTMDEGLDDAGAGAGDDAGDDQCSQRLFPEASENS